jgi:ATP-binding cassette subfamily B protein
MLLSFVSTFIKTNIFHITTYLFLILILATQKVAIPHVYGKIITSLTNKDTTVSQTLFLILIAVWIGYQLIDILSNYVDSILLPKLQNNARQVIFNTILKAYSEDYQELDLGDITSKIIKFPESIRDIFMKIKSFVFVHLFGLAISLIYVLFINIKLGILVFISYIIIFALCYLFMNQCSPVALQREHIFDETQEQIQDTLLNNLCVYTTSNEENEIQRIAEYNGKCESSQRKSIRCVNFYRSIYSFVFILIFFIYNYASYYLFLSGELSLSSLTSFFIITFVLLGNMLNFMNDTNSFIYSWTKLKSVTDYVETLYNPKTKEKHFFKNLTNTEIVLKELQYGKIINKMNITIKKGEHIAIIGPIGIGKSTLAHLLVKLKKPTSGDILIGGKNITNMTTKQLRDIICYIPQNPRLFNRTLIENLQYGLGRKLHKKEVVDLLVTHQLSELANLFEQRFDESVGKFGSHFSGGQRQIIWLMKAILGNFPIIILDEPTSSLDELSRKQVIYLIKKLSRNKTLIIITHDKDILSHMDRVITLS